MKIYTASLDGLHPVLTQIEADISSGFPSFNIVGLGDVAIKEARERIRSAIKNSGLKFPTQKKVINLTPAGLRKQGSLFDLPIAMSLLFASGQLLASLHEPLFCAGELMLSGRLRKVPGILPITHYARSKGFKKIYIPFANRNEASLIEGIEVIPVKHLKEITNHLNLQRSVARYTKTKITNSSPNCTVDYADIYGHQIPKRVLEIAACSNLHVLLVGPPGTGKTMLAKALPGICPKLNSKDSLEVSMVYSVAKEAGNSKLPIQVKPFRYVHNCTSNVTITGGGNPFKIGEISLAHRGILFLDELAEFKRDAIEALRQPLQEGVIRIGKHGRMRTLPAKFQLVAAMNPCACGYFQDDQKACKCSEYQIKQYYKKISGPVLDRIDLIIGVPRLSKENLKKPRKQESSSNILKRVERVHATQLKRGIFNNEFSLKDARSVCRLSKQAENFLKSAMEAMGISVRSYLSILRISRTIADLEGRKTVQQKHISEALQYKRPLFNL